MAGVEQLEHRVAPGLRQSVVQGAVDRVGRSQPLRIEGAECVRKSYPEFWQDFQALGGIIQKEGE